VPQQCAHTPAGSRRYPLYHFALQIHPKMRGYFPRRRDETFAGRSEEVVASAGRRMGRPTRRSNAEKAPRPDSTGSKQNLSRLAGSGGSVLRIGVTGSLEEHPVRTDSSSRRTVTGCCWCCPQRRAHEQDCGSWPAVTCFLPKFGDQGIKAF